MKLLLLSAIFALSFTGCQNKPTTTAEELAPVETYTITEADRSSIQDASSVIESIIEINVSAKTYVELGVVFDFEVVQDGITLVDRNQGRVTPNSETAIRPSTTAKEYRRSAFTGES